MSDSPRPRPCRLHRTLKTPSPSSAPAKESERKTLERLMTMQKDVQRGRTKLAERRSRGMSCTDVVVATGGSKTVTNPRRDYRRSPFVSTTFSRTAMSSSTEVPAPTGEKISSSNHHGSNRPSTPSVVFFPWINRSARRSYRSKGTAKMMGQPARSCSPG